MGGVDDDLFSWSPPNEGLLLGHAAAEMAAEAAGEEWKEKAYEAFCNLVRGRGTCTIEDVREAHPELATPPGGERRAWGQIPLRAQRAGLVRSRGWVSARDRAVHGNAVTLWELRPDEPPRA